MTAEREAARRGALLLDRELPGWTDRVDLAALDMRSCQRCVLGQLLGRYLAGVQALAPSGGHVDRWAWAVRHGFTLPVPLGYGKLTRAWFDEVERRRGSEEPEA